MGEGRDVLLHPGVDLSAAHKAVSVLIQTVPLLGHLRRLSRALLPCDLLRIQKLAQFKLLALILAQHKALEGDHVFPPVSLKTAMLDIRLHEPGAELGEVQPPAAVRVHNRELGAKFVAAPVQADVRCFLEQTLEIDGVFVLPVAQMESKQRAMSVHQVDEQRTHNVLLHKRSFRIIICVCSDLQPPQSRDAHADGVPATASACAPSC